MVIEGVSMIMVVMGICGKSHKQAHNFVKLIHTNFLKGEVSPQLDGSEESEF